MSLEHLWVLLLLPLPLLVHKFLPARTESEQSLRVPFFDRLVAATGAEPGDTSVIRVRRKAQVVMLVLAWVALILVLAEPVRFGAIVNEREYGRDLMIAVDLSQSMDQKDFPSTDGQLVSRWDGLQNIMTQFAEDRKGDRLGLIAFGTGAYLQVPFTPDASMWVNLLHQLQTGMAGPATAIGDAIGLSMRNFDTTESQEKMLILVTDGSDNASRLPAVEAAKVAARSDVTIYTIAIGDPSKQSGNDEVDLESLQRIADITGGRAFEATDSKALQSILDDINQIQPSAYDIVSHRPKTLLYPWILGPVLILYMAMWLWFSLGELLKSRRQKHA